MKKILLILMLGCFLGVSAHAQLRDIPAAVTNAFHDKFPGATDVSWKDHGTNFQAEFKMNGTDYEADFNKKGMLKRTEKTISYEALPDAVKTAFTASKYSSWERGSVAEVSDHDHALRYRIFVEKNTIQKKFIYFDKNGKLVKTGNI
ncbi:MAG TPA: PepSY-like domain-containing protein [Chitinophagaceae bacterium]